MLVSEIFTPERIKIGLEAEDKEEVFEELVDQFCYVSRCGAREEILGAVKKREAKMSTGIRQGIALPHGKTNAVSRITGILGTSKRGIDYEALDGKPVHLVFMILTPDEDAETHLKVLQRLAELLDNPEFYTELLSQSDTQSAFGTIRKYEDMLNALA
jgi:PTS system fructose-specific IIC component/PTS system nitrogen regulatory IIA component